MRKVLLAASCVVMLASCEEKAPVINFGEPIAQDTTFVLPTVPAAEKHNVLVEEFTGQSCSNCPAAHELLTEIQHAHEPGRVNVIGLYFEGITQTRPPHDAKYDFRHPQAKLIATDIYSGVSAIPAGGVERVANGGSIKLDKSVWTSTIDTRLNVPSPVNLKIESEYNSTDSIASIRATLVYTSKVDFPHNISIVVVEDSIIDKQEYPSTHPVHPGYDEAYLFTNVFRGMVTSAPYGDPVLTSVTAKEPGRAFIKNFKYKLTNALNPANCRVIAFINSTKSGDPQIIQSAQVKLK